jgi:hypothetical protein
MAELARVVTSIAGAATSDSGPALWLSDAEPWAAGHWLSCRTTWIAFLVPALAAALRHALRGTPWTNRALLVSLRMLTLLSCAATELAFIGAIWRVLVAVSAAAGFSHGSRAGASEAPLAAPSWAADPFAGWLVDYGTLGLMAMLLICPTPPAFMGDSPHGPSRPLASLVPQEQAALAASLVPQEQAARAASPVPAGGPPTPSSPPSAFSPVSPLTGSPDTKHSDARHSGGEPEVKYLPGSAETRHSEAGTSGASRDAASAKTIAARLDANVARVAHYQRRLLGTLVASVLPPRAAGRRRARAAGGTWLQSALCGTWLQSALCGTWLQSALCGAWLQSALCGARLQSALRVAWLQSAPSAAGWVGWLPWGSLSLVALVAESVRAILSPGCAILVMLAGHFWRALLLASACVCHLAGLLRGVLLGGPREELGRWLAQDFFFAALLAAAARLLIRVGRAVWALALAPSSHALARAWAASREWGARYGALLARLLAIGLVAPCFAISLAAEREEEQGSDADPTGVGLGLTPLLAACSPEAPSGEADVLGPQPGGEDEAFFAAAERGERRKVARRDLSRVAADLSLLMPLPLLLWIWAISVWLREMGPAACGLDGYVGASDLFSACVTALVILLYAAYLVQVIFRPQLPWDQVPPLVLCFFSLSLGSYLSLLLHLRRRFASS